MIQKTKYLAYWDSEGLECLFNISEWEKQLTWTLLKDEPPPPAPNPKILIIGATKRIHLSPEIYIFESGLLLECDVRDAFECSPQSIISLIRESGYLLYNTDPIK